MDLKKFFYRITHWEAWNYYLKYVPLIPAWIWYCIRSGSWWFFTPSNPTLTFGGFEGESKKEMYDQLPPSSYPKSIYIFPSMPFEEVVKMVESHRYEYPFAVKPDVGMKGFLFRKISNRDELKLYHEKMPVNYIVQDFIQYPVEISLFYYRFPDQQKGTITGFLRKEAMEVTGDGKSSLWDLIIHHPKASFMLEEMKAKHEKKLNDIIPAGESFFLSYAANLNRGGKFVNLSHEKDDRLLQVFDDLSHYTKYFYYGRYDIKCQSVEDLKEGKNFSILEFNGSGAEPHHIYGAGYSLVQACAILLHHWKILYQISRYNHKQGLRYWGFRKGWNFLKEAKKHFKMLEQLDSEFLLF